MRPIVLVVGGSDSCGGAGLAADIRTVEACGGHAAPVVAAITAQNTRAVVAWSGVDATLLGAQIDAVLDDLDVAAVKSGMLGTAAAVEVLAQRIERVPGIPFVCDPVLRASTGQRLLEPDAWSLLRERLLPLAHLVTPNRDEAQALTGLTVRGPDDAERAGAALRAAGARAVLITGGHFEAARGVDVLVEAGGTTRFESDAVAAANDHGTGCVLASAIATHLGRGLGLDEAIRRAKQLVVAAIVGGRAIGRGRGVVDPLAARRAVAAGPE